MTIPLAGSLVLSEQFASPGVRRTNAADRFQVDSLHHRPPAENWFLLLPKEIRGMRVL
jgi:hypothetical protein